MIIKSDSIIRSKAIVTRTEAIKNFLVHKTHPDLASDYGINMECQVNVGQDGGERVEGEFKGRNWQGWTDGVTTWKSFRIPYNAKSEPHYEDKPIHFDLAEHAEGIGMTGWDWSSKVSKWVAFDFDSIIGHNQGLSNEEMDEIKQAATNIDWVTVRKSTSGRGLHLYVYLNNIETQNHNEHAALARAILGQMSALTGFDFENKVDTCGGNLWVWHRKMEGTDGLKLIKKGSVLEEIPPYWKDHVNVIRGTKLKNLPQDIEETVEDLSAQRPRIKLDEEHKKLVNYFKDEDVRWWWESDQHMLITHTYFLKKAHEALGLKGFFDTIASGKEAPQDHNCFMFPIRRGAWIVRRYSQGVQEHDSWTQDGAGWTKCYFNKEPDLRTACRAYGAVEDDDGGFSFREAEIAQAAAYLLGVNLKIPPYMATRPVKLKKHKDGRLLIQIEKDERDRPDDMPGWMPKKGKGWQQIFNTRVESETEIEVGNYDDLVRHVITPNDEDSGWVIKTDGQWRLEPKDNIKIAMKSMGITPKDVDIILGSSVFKPFLLVNKPFQPEYPGDREWNRRGAKLKYTPTQDKDKFEYPNWSRLLSHSGRGLDHAVKEHPWCQANGIITGSDYLKCWAASLLQKPLEPLPYLFFYSKEQNTGKSIFHEALSLLFTHGYMRAESALINPSGFNAELEGQVLCVIEEIDLSSSRTALNRIKDWVTSRELLIHAKTKTPYHIPNSTHYIQCANELSFCPIFPGDTRVTVIHVEPLSVTELIPKRKFMPLLEKEAPDFLAELISLEIPESPDRLNIPVVDTGHKSIAAQANISPVEEFISEYCQESDGHVIKYSEFFERFMSWIDNSLAGDWNNRRKVKASIPSKFPSARLRKDNHVYVGNISWDEVEPKDFKYTVSGDHLIEVKK